MAQAAFQFYGGDLALEFVNTVDWRLDPSRSTDLWASDADLDRWLKQAGVTPSRATRRLAEARRLRQELVAVLDPMCDGRRPEPAAMARVSERTRAADAATELMAQKDGWTERFRGEEQDQWAWEIMRAARRLLLAPESARIRRCADNDCGWFFVDASRTHRRRWCSMEGCGNRNKARAFRAALKQA